MHAGAVVWISAEQQGLRLQAAAIGEDGCRQDRANRKSPGAKPL
jgi:hypothetical protein